MQTKSLVAAAVLLLLQAGLSSQATRDTTERLAIRHFAAPPYPPGAWIGRVQGKVVAELSIRSDGSVESVAITSAHPLLRRGVEDALRQWFFQPIGRPTSLVVTVNFDLEGDCPEGPGTEPREANSYTATFVSADVPSTVKVSACAPMIVVNTDKTRG